MFSIHIECSKDIDKLNIDFSDGSSSVVHTPEKYNKPNKIHNAQDNATEMQQQHYEQPEQKDTIGEDLNMSSALDLDYGSDISNEEVIEKPIIETKNREVKIASELQNLEI